MSMNYEPGSSSTGDGQEPKSAAGKLFDIRLLIGGLFTLYGVMLTVAGLFTSDSARAKASNININLWLGIGMLVLGLLFLLWHRVNPLVVDAAGPDDEADRAQGPS